MAPRQNPKIGEAFRAMKELGLSEYVVKPVLKNLLRVYDKNWHYIEDENYRVLVDAIFEREDEKKRKPDDNDVPHELEQPLKRLRPSHESQNLPATEDGRATSSATSNQGPSLNSDTALADTDPQPLQVVMEAPKPPVCNINPMDESEPDSPPTSLRQRDRRLTSSKTLVIVEASETPPPWKKNEDLHFSQTGLDDQSKENMSPKHPSDKERTYSERSPQLLYSMDRQMEPQIIPEVVTDTHTFIKPKAEPEVSEIPTGEMAITVLLPETANEMYDATSFVEDVSFCEDGNATGSSTSLQGANLNSDTALAGIDPQPLQVVVEPLKPLVCNINPMDESEPDCLTSLRLRDRRLTLKALAMVEASEIPQPWKTNTEKLNQTKTKETTYLLDASDVTRGEENVKISIVNHFNDVLLPSFCYLHQNLVGQNAIVNVSLAQIAKEDCCPNCIGDCLSLKEPSICACTSGERCVYASDGILNEEFIEECKSMTRNPQKHRQFFCEDCPLEVGMDKDAVKPCQGHLVRKVVKECWLKCYCSKNCTNRWVQRGISHKLQVFMTSGGKGWGLRTLQDLPKGAFVCEFVGEILTLSELYHRYQSSFRNCACTMVLDAGWASSKELKVDKDRALCLDASAYGNVARFINHRCTDANLVAVPVKVETSDSFYHRVAFFTSRKVAALEEITREYGVNFDDFDGLTKPFRCHCGSSFCRNIKHYNRKRV